MLKIKPNLSTAFHPESDGQTERTHQSLQLHLRTFCNYQQDDWSTLLPIAEFAYNSTHHSTIGMSPFFANYAYHPRMSLTIHDSQERSALQLAQKIDETHDFAKASIARAHEQHAMWANRRRLPAPPFQEGDRVWLLRKHIATSRASGKLDHKKLGPFVIDKKISDNAFRLRLPATMRIHPTFHVSLLEKYKPNRHPQREVSEPPAPVINEDGTSRRVHETILDSSRHNDRLQYFVHWMGEPISQRSWIPVSDIPVDDPEVIKFHADNPTKPGHSRLKGKGRAHGARA